MIKKLLHRGLFIFISALFFTASHAQLKTVSGTVSDDKGAPLSGATVSVKNTKITAVTDAQGTFSVSIPTTAKILEVSFVGMQTSELSIGSKTSFNVTLAGGSNALNDVVVIGYGKAKRANLTSAQSSVSAKDMDRTVNTTVEQAIQGRAAGVYVTQNTGAPGGGMSITIRGISSINGKTEPLYVIDGVQVEGSGVNYGDQSASNPLSGLNPSDIDNVQILQGPTATSVYGSRAANGVVLITTKRGKAGDAKITYNFQHTQQTAPRRIAMMNLRQFAQITKEFHIIRKDEGNIPQEFEDPSLLGEGTDWQKELFKSVPMDKHQISVSGGSDKTTYFLSGEYFNQQGIAIGSGFKRYSFRLNVDSKLRDWATLGVNLNYSQTRESLTTGNEEVISRALSLTPQVPVKNLDGSWGNAGVDENQTLNNNVQHAPVNPIALASLITNRNIKRQLYGGVNLNIDIFKGLAFRTSLNTGIGNFYSDYFIPKYQIGYAQNVNALLREGTGTNANWNFNQLLEYSRQFGLHNVNIVASHEAQSNNYKNVGGSRIGFLTNTLFDLNPGDQKSSETSGGSGDDAIESYIGRVSYNYDNRYLVTAAFRADGSAKFGVNNRWGNFPSVSAAWRISQEHFFHVPFISELKLRGETGITGNTFWYNGSYASLSAGPTNEGVGFLSSRIPYLDSKWEQTQTINVGANIGLLKDRFQIEFDYYMRKTKNLLIEAILPSYDGGNGNGGARPPLVNDGTLHNNGWSITVNTTNINSRNFKWESSLNLSAFKTTIDKFNGGRTAVDRTSWWLNDWTQRSTVGGAPWLFRGYIVEGLFQSLEEINKSAVPVNNLGVRYPTLEDPSQGIWVGDVKFKDISGPQGVPDGKITEDDVTDIGNPWPKLFGGFTNSFSFKGFELSILLTGTYGNDIFNYFSYNINKIGNDIYQYRNIPLSAMDYAKPIVKDDGSVVLANPKTTIARLTTDGAEVLNGNNVRFTNRYVENGSYLRVKNISLSYTVPVSFLAKQKVIKGVRGTIGVQNIATITNYSGYDPEVGSYVDRNSSIGNQAVGLDNGRYPLTPIYTFNLGVNF